MFKLLKYAFKYRHFIKKALNNKHVRNGLVTVVNKAVGYKKK